MANLVCEMSKSNVRTNPLGRSTKFNDNIMKSVRGKITKITNQEKLFDVIKITQIRIFLRKTIKLVSDVPFSYFTTTFTVSD